MTEWLEKLGGEVTRIRRFIKDGRVRLVADVRSEVEVDGMVWINLQEDMLSLHEDDKELLRVASVITENAGTAEILESAMADLMVEEDAMLLSELECPPTAEEKLLKLALEECETDSQTETVAAGCFSMKKKHSFFVAAVNPEAPGHLLRAGDETAANTTMERVQPDCTLPLAVCQFVYEYGEMEGINADNSAYFRQAL